MSFVILCFNIYCLLLRSQHQLRFALQNSLNFFIGKCSFDFYWHYSSHNNPVKRGELFLTLLSPTTSARLCGTRCAFSPHTLRYRTCVPHGTTQIIDAFLFELLRLFLHQNHLARIFCYFCSHSFTSVRLLRLRAMTEQPLAVSLRTR